MQIIEIPRESAASAPDGPVYERMRTLLASRETPGLLARHIRSLHNWWEALDRRLVDTGALLGTRVALWVACGLAVLFTACSVLLVVRGGG